jgi:hypothetical protein
MRPAGHPAALKDYQSLYDRALWLGYKIGHEGQIGGDQGRFAYLIRDGSRPIREVGAR